MRILCAQVLMLMLPSGAMAADLADNRVYIDQIGSGNTLRVVQEQQGKTAVSLMRGDGNTIIVVQEDSGHHTAVVGLPSQGVGPDGRYVLPQSQGMDGNQLGVAQSGSGDHTASIAMDPGFDADGNSATITQSGAADKSFDLDLSGSNIGVTVVQDNYGTADTGSMSIQCYTGSCTGYSYTRH